MTMKPRLLIISQHFPPDRSGNASRIYDLSRNLVKLGSDVTVLSPFPSFPHGSYRQVWRLSRSHMVEGIQQRQLFSWQACAKDPSFFSRMGYYLLFPLHAIIWSLLLRKKYDVIITSVPPIFTGITGLFIKKMTGKKWFFDVRDLWIDASVSLGFIKKDSLFMRLSKHYEKLCYALSDGITVTTEEVKKSILKENTISPDKIFIIPNGVDTDVFKPSDTKHNRIIYTGNIGHAQDLSTVILAIKKINEHMPLEFYLIGDGDIKQDLEKLVKQEHLGDTVIFTGILKRERIPQLISESMIGIAPLKKLETLKYAIPTKVYEYMSCGTPFVATGAGEIEHLAKESGGGIIADNSVDSIYHSLLDLLHNTELIEEMKKNGRAYVKKYYDRRKIAEKLLEYIMQ